MHNLNLLYFHETWTQARLIKKRVGFWMEGKKREGCLREAKRLHRVFSIALRKPRGSGQQDVPSPGESGPSRSRSLSRPQRPSLSAVPVAPEGLSCWDCFCISEKILIQNSTQSWYAKGIKLNADTLRYYFTKHFEIGKHNISYLKSTQFKRAQQNTCSPFLPPQNLVEQTEGIERVTEC